MSENYSFFNAVVDETGGYDRIYVAEDFARYFASFIGNGVYGKPTDGLKVTAAGDMDVTVKSGSAFINGYFYNLDAPKTFTLKLPDGEASRIDRIVIRLDLTNRLMECAVKEGALNVANPTAPELTRSATVYEIGIADIKVNKNVLSVANADITDTRYDSALCGIVHGVIEQLDFSEAYRQFEESFNTWLDSVKDILDETPTGELVNTVEQVKDTSESAYAMATGAQQAANNAVDYVEAHMPKYGAKKLNFTYSSTSGRCTAKLTFDKNTHLLAVYLPATAKQVWYYRSNGFTEYTIVMMNTTADVANQSVDYIYQVA